MSFLSYYNIQKKDAIFESVFEKYYSAGYFGDINKDIIKSDQYEWFNRLVQLIQNKNSNELYAVMESFENKFSRECFDSIIGSSIKYKSRKDIRTTIEKYVIGEY